MSRKIFRTLIVLGILAYTFYYCVKSNVRFFYVTTGSMGPSVPEKSLIVSKKISANQVRMGWVVVFYDQVNKRVTAHRIIQLQGDGFITKGDVNDYEDKYLVKPEDIVGKVTGAIPVIDAIVMYLQLVLLALFYVLGVTQRRFLLFLKHGFSCPTAAVNTVYRLCIFRRSKKTFCGG